MWLNIYIFLHFVVAYLQLLPVEYCVDSCDNSYEEESEAEI